MIGTRNSRSERSLRVLFFVEGFTDIRFVVGLSEICDLTMAIPSSTYKSSGLDQRITNSQARLTVHEIPGGRLAFQARSIAYLLRHVGQFDVVLAQEVTRGALNANLVGRLHGVPVLNYMAISPVEYFACRRERRIIGRWQYWFGDAVIRTLLRVNGQFATGWLALGPYLESLARQWCRRVRPTYYYGVDTDYYRPVPSEEKSSLREQLGLPAKAFLILLSSRISHEKDPETVIRATARLRDAGLNAVILNLGGGYKDFQVLAEHMGLQNVEEWVLGRPAAHPMRELAAYYQASDALAQASLAEGLGLSPLEALACGVPVVATAVGGMAAVLPGFARLVPRRDDQRMAEELTWVASHPKEARAQALGARETLVLPEWNRANVFANLKVTIRQAVGRSRQTAASSQPLPAPRAVL